MSNFETGNVSTKANGDRGWIIGHFIDPSLPFHNKNFEVQWAELEAGEAKAEPAANQTAKTMCILVYGQIEVDFPDDHKKVILKTEGDYLFFGPGILHSWKTSAKSLVITIRWPSLPADQQ